MTINIDLLCYQLTQAGLPVVGVATTGRIDYSRDLTPTEQSLSDTIVANHDPAGLLPWQQDSLDAQTAITTARQLPNWASFTPQQAHDAVINSVFSGVTQATVDTQIQAITTLAGAKVALQQCADSLVTLRDILAIVVQLLVYIRIAVVKTSNTPIQNLTSKTGL